MHRSHRGAALSRRGQVGAVQNPACMKNHFFRPRKRLFGESIGNRGNRAIGNGHQDDVRGSKSLRIFRRLASLHQPRGAPGGGERRGQNRPDCVLLDRQKCCQGPPHAPWSDEADFNHKVSRQSQLRRGGRLPVSWGDSRLARISHHLTVEVCEDPSPTAPRARAQRPERRLA